MLGCAATNGAQVALVATTPWDSHLIHTRIWTYPPNVIIGPTLFDIPAEEVFFFVIQTYITSLLYLIVSKPMFHPVYLRGGKAQDRFKWRTWCWVGQAILTGIILVGAELVSQGSEGLYMGLILVWATPVLLFLWYVLLGAISMLQDAKGKQEHRVSIPYRPASDLHSPPDRASNRLPLDHRHDGIEPRYLGD